MNKKIKKKEEVLKEDEKIIENGKKSLEKKDLKGIEEKKILEEKDLKEKLGDKKIVEGNKKERKTNLVLLVVGILIFVSFLFFVYTKNQIDFNYKGIEYQMKSYGEGIYLYDTLTLLPRNDGVKGNFGFRLETNPNELKKIYFEDVDNFKLMNLNAYKFVNGSFSCGGDGVIGITQLNRVIENTGGKIYYDPNATCDNEGRYNLFIFEYGTKNRINKIGENCYQVVVKGEDSSCEIRKLTDKLMAEIFSKYKIFVEN